MKRKITARTIVVVLVLWFVGGNTAFGFNQEDIEIHGFVSQGYLRSSDNNYLGNTKDGSFEFNEIGLNFSVPVTDGLHCGAQLFSMDLGDYGNNEFFVDWAFLDYTWKNWLGFRAGKIKMPVGLYNRHRDADTLRTSILLPQSVYIPNVRDMMLAFYGADVYGTQPLGNVGYIDYETFAGTLDMKNDAGYITDNLLRLGASSSTGMPSSLPEGIEFDVYLKHVEGGALYWHPPVGGLRIGGTVMAGKMRNEASLAGFTTITDTDINWVCVLSVEYEIANFILAAEYVDIDMDTRTDGLNQFSIEKEGYYGSISWKAMDWLALGASYSEYYPDKNDKDGKIIEAGGLEDFFAWQKDATLTVRFDVTEYWCVKLEAHFINGLGMADIIANPPDETEQNWMLYAVKTSIGF